MNGVVSVPSAALDFKVSNAPPSDWDEFASKHSAYLFHRSIWNEVLREGYGSEVIYGTLLRGGETVLGISGVVFDVKLMRIFFSNMPYGGLIGDLQYVPEFLAAFEPALRKRGIHQIRMTRTARYGSQLPSAYLSKQPTCQHRVNLAGHSRESLWEGYSRNVRRDVRKAMRSGVNVRPITSEEGLEVYFRLYLETMTRNRAPTFYTKRFYRAIYRHLVSKNLATMFLAEREGRVIAGIILIYSDDTAHLLGSASSSDAFRFCPNEFLLHQGMELTLSRGLRYFDFMMSPPGDERLMKFKDKWNAERFPFDILEKDLSWLRPRLWNFAWRLAQSRVGLKLLQAIQSR
jgi:CelD/BcsL family acetyltransferase involved in cellulose biosynthesis